MRCGNPRRAHSGSRLPARARIDFHRSIGAHAARIRPLVVVLKPLVIPAKRQEPIVFSVANGHRRKLGAFEAALAHLSDARPAPQPMPRPKPILLVAAALVGAAGLAGATYWLGNRSITPASTPPAW